VAELVDAALSKRVFLWVQVPSPPCSVCSILGSWCNGNITRLHRVAVSSILALPTKNGGIA